MLFCGFFHSYEPRPLVTAPLLIPFISLIPLGTLILSQACRVPSQGQCRTLRRSWLQYRRRREYNLGKELHSQQCKPELEKPIESGLFSGTSYTPHSGSDQILCCRAARTHRLEQCTTRPNGAMHPNVTRKPGSRRKTKSSAGSYIGTTKKSQGKSFG